MTRCSGACWSPARLLEEGIITAEEAVCPSCGHKEVDEGHLFWECPEVMENRHPSKQKSNSFCAEYSRCKHDPTCRALYWGGLVSEQETTPAGQIFDTVESLGPITEYEDTKVTIFTDGSGGKRTKDKRLRRCGWAWVLPQPGSNKLARYGARGALGGLQTVPRAELRAIHHCLSSIKGHKHIKELVIYSDCKMAVDGIAKGRQHTSKIKLGQLWTCVWDEYEACVDSGIHITVLKVKSHEKTPARCHKSCKMAITAQITTRDSGLENAPVVKQIGSIISMARQDGSRKEWYRPCLCYQKKVDTPMRGTILEPSAHTTYYPEKCQGSVTEARSNQKRAHARMHGMWRVLGVRGLQHAFLRGGLPWAKNIWPSTKREAMDYTSK